MHCMQVEFGHKTVKFEITGLASGMNKIANKVRFMRENNYSTTECVLNFKQSKYKIEIPPIVNNYDKTIG